MACNPPKRALVFLAPGTEEMEFTIVVDVLVRAGIEVNVAGVSNKTLIRCSKGVIILPDVALAEACKCKPFDLVVLPGGRRGSRTLAESKEVGAILKSHDAKKKLIAAISVAPTVLKVHEIGLGKCVTSDPSVKCELECLYRYKEDKVVVDRNLITSRGPGTAFAFALKLVEKLAGKEKAGQVAKELLLSC